MKYLVLVIVCNDVHIAIQCITNEEAIETYNKLCNYYYNNDALETFMQKNNYEEKTTEVFDNYYKSEEYCDFGDNSNITIIEIDI